MRITIELTEELAEVTADALEDHAEALHQRLVQILHDHEGRGVFDYIAHREGEARVAGRIIRSALQAAHVEAPPELELRALAGDR